MIYMFGKAHDQICVVVDSEPIIVNLERLSSCRVNGCVGSIEYGYSFCRKHRWILPFPAEKVPDGFQVGLIDYWKNKKKKVIATHSYDKGEKN